MHLRHLIARGMSPGVEFGTLLNAAFEAQLEGSFTDGEGAMNWLAPHLDVRRIMGLPNFGQGAGCEVAWTGSAALCDEAFFRFSPARFFSGKILAGNFFKLPSEDPI